MVVAEEVNVDEAVTVESEASNDTEIDLKEEWNTQAYKETINKDFENFNTFKIKIKSMEDSIRGYRTIVFKKFDTFPEDFI